VEFIEPPPRAHEDGDTSTSVQAQGRQVLQLSPEARLDLTGTIRDYIFELVASHSGGSEDVRSIIRDLHDQISVSDHRRER
jgi:hypothetical protein